jgi:hypothetical protein
VGAGLSDELFQVSYRLTQAAVASSLREKTPIFPIYEDKLPIM